MKKLFLIMLFFISSWFFIGCNNESNDEFKITFIEATTDIVEVKVGDFEALPVDYDGVGDFSDCKIEIDELGIIEIEDGLITGLKVGVCNVKVMSKNNKDLFDTFKVYVNEKDFVKRTIVFDLPTTGYKIGSSVPFKIKNMEKLGITSLNEVNIFISDESVVSIDDNYVLHFLKKGKVTLRVEVKDCPSNNGEIELFVENQSDDTTRSGEPDNTPLLLHFEDGNYTIDCSKDEQLLISGAKRYQSYYYSTSNEDVLLVSDDGNLMGLKEGTVQIRVTSKDSRNKITKNTITVTVTGIRYRDDIIDRFVNMALSQEGVTERDHDNHTRYTEWNHCYDAWCATFMSWCANQSGVPKNVIPRTISVLVCKKNFEIMNRFFYKESYHPVRGDLIIFLSAGASHVGIVTGSDDNRVYTIEGNTQDMVAQRTYYLNFKEITGYCHPDFESCMTPNE